MKRVLEYSHSDARRFFLKEESYFNFDLPKYFIFDKVLQKVSQKLENKSLSSFYIISAKSKSCAPCNYDDVNYKLLNNKDGKYAWRQMELIHPAIYVSLVHLITQEEHWRTIVKRFTQFGKNHNIECTSLPIESDNNLSDKANTVSKWWEFTEQKSIKLALDFEYLLHTDIVDCYSSIYTHSVAWALHTKKEAKEKKGDKNLIGNIIDKHLQDMSFGQTNGIPQGSVLMDFIAEMVLGFADLELSEVLSQSSINDYKIVRYRDDYRIFTNNPCEGEVILKYLTEVLIELGLRLNPHKTSSSNNVVQHSLKPDKLYWILNEKKCGSLQKHLIIIHDLSCKFPNSGSLVKALTVFFAKIKGRKKIKNNVEALISIIVEIALRNPRTYPISAAILSKLLSLVESSDKQTQIIKSIIKKFDRVPNIGYLEVWLQRTIIKMDIPDGFKEKLCCKVNDPSVKIWNSAWLNNSSSIFKIIEEENIIDSKTIEDMDLVVNIEEVQLFDSKSNY